MLDHLISMDTIQVKLDGGEKIKLKWKEKTHFIAQKPSGGFTNESIQYVYALCTALNNTKYTQIQKGSTVYYGSQQNTTINLKGNKIVVKGNLIKGTKKSVGELKGKTFKLKKSSRTFKLDKSFKAYSYNGYLEKYYKISKEELSNYINSGLYVIFTVKNSKVTRIDFYS